MIVKRREIQKKESLNCDSFFVRIRHLIGIGMFEYVDYFYFFLPVYF